MTVYVVMIDRDIDDWDSQFEIAEIFDSEEKANKYVETNLTDSNEFLIETWKVL